MLSRSARNLHFLFGVFLHFITGDDNDQIKILREQYEVEPFSINTILLERIFVDKIFASEFYYMRGEYFDVSKHIYDLAVLSSLERIQTLLSNPDQLTAMMAFKRREERARIGSDLSEKPISKFLIFNSMVANKDLQDRFVSMQDIYIFNDRDKIDFQHVASSLLSLKEYLLSERM